MFSIASSDTFSGVNEWLSEKPLHRVKTEVAAWLRLNTEHTVSVFIQLSKRRPHGFTAPIICGKKARFGFPGLAEVG